jgi:hypothetical protein
VSELSDEVDQALCLLNSANADATQPPAIVILPPDADRFIIGNKGGLLQLAIAALKAAQGEEQLFDKVPWVVEEDADWGVKGLKLDDYAHLHLPEKKSRAGQVLGRIWGYSILVAVSAIFVTGSATASHWLWGLFSHR